MKEKAVLKLRQIQPGIARLLGLKAKINNMEPLFSPIKERQYFKFTLQHEDTHCESMLDVVTWLESEWVERDTLAWQDIDSFYLGYLFGIKVPTLSIPVLAKRIYQVKDIRIVSGTEIAEEKIRIPSPVGELLFEDIPQAMLPVNVFIPPRALKIPLKFILGTSLIKFARLVCVSCGDLLLLQQHNPHVYVADKRAFGFNLSEEGIMIDEEDEDIAEDDEEIEENMEDIDNREEDDSSIDNTNALISEESPVKFDRNKINLKISFLLQQQNMTLEEISHLHTGSLVPLLPEAEKKIIVTVNNQRYAKGELIQIGDQLAVEITEIYFEKDK